MSTALNGGISYTDGLPEYKCGGLEGSPSCPTDTEGLQDPDPVDDVAADEDTPVEFAGGNSSPNTLESRKIK